MPNSEPRTTPISPRLRFPEFRSPWQSKKLGKIASFSKGSGISKDDINTVGTTEAIRYGELYTVYREVICEIKSRTGIEPGRLVLSKNNDVIIPASGETCVDIATASCVKKDGIAIGGDINIVRTKNDGVFIAYYLNNAKKMEIARLAQGVSVVHLYGSELKRLRLNLPVIQEQEKIARILMAIDEKCFILSKRVDFLKRYKNGLLQALLAQKLRFRDDEGKVFPDWRRKTLGDLAAKIKTKNRDGANKEVLTNSAIRGIVRQRDYFDKDIADKSNLTNYYVVSCDDFVYNPRVSISAPVGPIRRNHLSAGVMSPLYSVFRLTRGDPDFFEGYFQTTLWHDYMKGVANSGARHDRMNITTSDLYMLPLPFPPPEEQKKIADLLIALDDKIKLEESKLEQAKRFKKALLQQMFV